MDILTFQHSVVKRLNSSFFFLFFIFLARSPFSDRKNFYCMLGELFIYSFVYLIYFIHNFSVIYFILVYL